ncbi:aspartyl/glutamyl-tRNA(Asn/Gln) amidotransferase subunit A [Thalassoporum mexicanum PCC 7367]|uniref:Asp-tRNA(Asn)/Glu-tRNA(Gln) amidotransferase subunit GatA n=1 Tax=Thalassoporum mexicanum TaxID=3457544 RepID=UPI00029FA0C2|nr:Asp-tRNA(Asn)/Glu-tRNA(Gln) amidotransferase subunit GatA [Pseudanabaena sp. PCC 7367]AFY71103.1 aspartyl/glutamyl-tRNA(Asn/Gln) amidotransferase subunit A [Pseudanabaena sp. PCC 7367]
MLSTIEEIQSALVNHDRSAVEIAQEFIDRAQALEPKLHSFINLTPEIAIAQAEAIDDIIASGEPMPKLAGIPIGIKDNMCVKGTLTTCGSDMLANFVAPYESTVTAKIAKAGAVMIGKANLDEFAMGSSTENSAFGATANPWNLECVPGGSSGGSAAAVAAGECVISTGSDTGGSIRLPASFCGVVGLKPTYGLVSRYGLVAFASSLDQIGPFANTVKDAATLLSVLAGHDPQDSTSLDVPIPNYPNLLTADLTQSLKGKKVGVITETFGEGLSEEVAAAVKKTIAHMESMGAEIKEISCPRFAYGLPTYYIIAPSEASANLARYDGVKYGFRQPDIDNLLEMYAQTRETGFGTEVKRRIMIGTYALSAGYYDAYYLKAQKVRTLIRQDFDRAFEQVDVLVSPVSPTTAFKAGAKTEDPLGMYLTDLMTIPVNLAGLPGLSLPCGFDAAGMPIGLQMISNALREDVLLQVAYGYEQSTDWHKKKPMLSS